MSDTTHVIPLDDLIEHETDGADCVCGPEVEPVERHDGSIAWVVSHHSLDGREHRERDHDRQSCAVCSVPRRRRGGLLRRLLDWWRGCDTPR